MARSRIKWLLVPALAAALVVIPSTTLIPSATATGHFGAVTGTVTDADSGDPVAAAFINVLVGATPEDPSGSFIALAESGLDGVYLVEDLEPGSALLTVDKLGFERFEAFISVPNSDTLTIDVALIPAIEGSITGVVSDAESEAPIDGAFVNVLVGATPDDPTGSAVALAESGPDGVYLVENLPPGPVLLTIDATGYTRFEVFFDVMGDTSHTIDVAMVLASLAPPTTVPSTLPLTGVPGQLPVAGLVALLAGVTLLAGCARRRVSSHPPGVASQVASMTGPQSENGFNRRVPKAESSSLNAPVRVSPPSTKAKVLPTR